MLVRTVLLLGLAALISCSSNGSSSGSSSYMSSVSSPREGGGITYRLTVAQGGLEREIDMDGRFELSDDDREIVAMDPGGRLSIDEAAPHRRRVVIVAPTGIPIVEYWSDGEKQELDAPAEQWLRSIVAEVAQSAGLGAAARADRIFENGGPSALVGAAELTASDASRRVYMSRLLEVDDLDTGLLTRIVKLGHGFVADSQKRELVERVILVEPTNASLTTEILDLIGNVVSSSGQAELLQQLIATRPLEGVQGQHFLRVAREIVSDSGKGSVLEAAITKLPAEHRIELIETFGSIVSSSRQGALYQTYIETVSLDEQSATLLADQARGIVSNSAREETVATLIDHAPVSEDVDSAILRAADSVLSSKSKERLLTDFLEKRTFSEAVAAQLEKVIGNTVSASSRSRLQEKLKAARGQ